MIICPILHHSLPTLRVTVCSSMAEAVLDSKVCRSQLTPDLFYPPPPQGGVRVVRPQGRLQEGALTREETLLAMESHALALGTWSTGTALVRYLDYWYITWPLPGLLHCFRRPPLFGVRSACGRLLSKRLHLARIEEETLHLALSVLLGYD